MRVNSRTWLNGDDGNNNNNDFATSNDEEQVDSDAALVSDGSQEENDGNNTTTNHDGGSGECNSSMMSEVVALSLTHDDTALAEGLELSRITVNTHTSLLNVTEDEDDDDIDAEMSTYFPAFLEDYDDRDDEPNANEHHWLFLNNSATRSDTPPILPQPCCDSNDVVARTDSSFIDRLSESFVDSFCTNNHQPSPNQTQQQQPEDDLMWEGYKHLLQTDIIEILSLISPPSSREIKYLWTYDPYTAHLLCPVALSTSSFSSPLSQAGCPTRPHKLSRHQRALRVREVLGTELPHYDRRLLRETRSVDQCQPTGREHHPLSKLIGAGLDPILPVSPDIELGYDSDPGVACSVTPMRVTIQPPPLDLSNLAQLVQETLNMTFILTWHSTPHPCSIRVWMERGNILQQNPGIVEPCLMWQPAAGNSLLTTCPPHCIRFLNLCRILPLQKRDPRRYPFARSNRCIVLRTTEDEEYVFEAPTVEERDQILLRWKHVVARFATLAVLEDVSHIQDEFFRPLTCPTMPVPERYYYQANSFSEADRQGS